MPDCWFKGWLRADVGGGALQQFALCWRRVVHSAGQSRQAANAEQLHKWGRVRVHQPEEQGDTGSDIALQCIVAQTSVRPDAIATQTKTTLSSTELGKPCALVKLME